MRNTLLITFTLLTLIFGCKKSESTSPPPPPPNSGSGYTIKIGDTWWFHRWSKKDTIIKTDTTKSTVVKETTFNINNKTIPAYVIVDSSDTSSRSYFHFSDSIVEMAPVTFHFDTTYDTFFTPVRLIRANVKVGDTWEDTTPPLPLVGRFRIKSTVKAVNVNENVPAGSFIVTKVGQDIYSDIWGYLGYREFSINKDTIFVKDSSMTPNCHTNNGFSIKISKWYSKIAWTCDTTYSAGKLIKFQRGSN
jgi:hypothetical protein